MKTVLKKLKVLFAAFKCSSAAFLKKRGKYVAACTILASVAAAAILMFTPKGGETEPVPTPETDPASVSQGDTLALMRTPQPTPTPTPTVAPDFTPAPKNTNKSARELMEPPVKGAVIWGYAVDELIYSRTLDQWTTHSGVDLASPKGSEVYSIFPGTVEAVYADDALGVCVKVRGAELTAVYGNLKEETALEEGAKCDRGSVVGFIGDTAVSECGDKSHVHFELWKDDKPIDPNGYVRFIKE